MLVDPAFGMSVQGADALRATIPSAWAGVTVEAFDVLARFGSINGYVMTHGRARGFMDFGPAIARFDVPFTLVARFQDGKVVRHEDFPDYPCVNRQILAQADAPLAYELLPTCIG